MATTEGKANPPGKFIATVRRAARLLSARLRFVAVFALVFAVIGGWETIRTYWARWTAGATVEAATSSDTDFFCPMDPGVLSDWPSKCPICNMTLVRRKKGDAAPLPDGVVARMQFTPYRLWLGGIRTATIDYAPLGLTIEAPGVVGTTSDGLQRVEAEVFSDQLDRIAPGQGVEISLPGDRAGVRLKARVRETPRRKSELGVERIVVELEGTAVGIRPGDQVRVSILIPAESIEPFRQMPSIPPALKVNEPRYLYTCMDHPDVSSDSPGRCPRDQSELMGHALRPNQRIRWWCPMHPSVTSERAGEKCEACGGMVLSPRLISFRLPGTVLGVPSSAVVDDGTRSLVYVERGVGMFDATVVTLGPRCGEMFPVIAGLEPGDRVAAQGAFLIDAETRLNPGLASGYFGAGERSHARIDHPEKTEWSEGLSAADRPLAIRQKLCPVTGKPLGSMGVPTRVEIRGRVIFLCCDGCLGTIQASPDKYLSKRPGSVGEGRP